MGGRLRVLCASCLGVALVVVAAASASVSLSLTTTPPFEDQFGEGQTGGAGVTSVAISGTTAYTAGHFLYAGGTQTGSFAQLSPSAGAPLAGAVFEGGPVLTSTADGSGGWYVGGTFTSVDGTSHPGLAHIRADGTLDRSFKASVAGIPGSAVTAMAVYGSTLYIGGSFNHANGEWRYGTAAFDTTTGALTSWDVNVEQDPQAIVATATAVYLAGDFSFYNNHTTPSTGLIGVDPDTGLESWDPGINGMVGALALDGRTLYAAGNFTTPRHGLTAFDTVTQTVTSWNPSLSAGSSFVGAGSIIVTPSTVYVAGRFTKAGSVARTGLAAFDRTTGATTSWAPRLTRTGDLPEVSAARLVGSTIFVGGTFSTAGGTPRTNLAAVDATTGKVLPFAPQVDGPVTTLEASSGSVHVGGVFETVGGEARSSLAAFDLSSGALLPWEPAAEADGILAVAGSTVFVSTVTGVSAFDAATGELKWSRDFDIFRSVHALVVSGPRLYVAGGFTSVDGRSRPHAAALSTATGAVLAWNPAPNGDVYALAVAGTNVYLGGSFSTVDGSVARSNLAAVDVKYGQVRPWHASTDGTVRALAVSGTTVLAGGSFRRAGGVVRPALAAFTTPSGTLLPWNPNLRRPATVDAISVSRGTAFVGGSFVYVGTTRRTNLAAIDLSSGAATAWNPSTDGEVHAVDTSPSYVVSSGDFSEVSKLPRARVAAWRAG